MRRAALFLAGLMVAIAGVAGPHAADWIDHLLSGRPVAATAPAPPNVVVDEQAFTLQPTYDGAVRWAVYVRNTDEDRWVGRGRIVVTFTDAIGDVVGTGDWWFGRIAPGERVLAAFEQVQVSAEPTSMSATVTDVEELAITPMPGALTTRLISVEEMDGPTTLRVLGAVRSTLPGDVAVGSAYAVFRDDAGTLLTAAPIYTGGMFTIQAGVEVGVDSWIFDAPTGAAVTIDVSFEDPGSAIAPPGDSGIVLLESGGGSYAFTSWGAVVENSRADLWAPYEVWVTATFRDDAGNIVGADESVATANVLPGQTVAAGYDLYGTLAFSTVDVTIVPSGWFQLEAATERGVVFEDIALAGPQGLRTWTASARSADTTAVGATVAAVFRDSDGIIVGGQMVKYGLDVPATGTVPLTGEDRAGIPDIGSVELYASTFRDGPEPPPDATPTEGFRQPDTLVPELTTYIPTPKDVSVEPPVVGANLVLAAVLMLLFAAAAELLNKALGRGELLLERVFPPARWVRRAQRRADRTVRVSLHHRSALTFVRLGGLFLIYGLAFSIIEPSWNPFSVTGLFLVLALAVAFGLVGVSPDLARWMAAKRAGLQARLDMRPANVLLALGSAGLSRLLGLLPGVFFGAPEAFDADETQITPETEWRLGRAEGLVTLGVAAGSWVATIGTDRLLGASLPGWADTLIGGVQALLLLVFAVAIENLFQEMLGLPGSTGEALRRHARWIWLVALVASAFALWQTLVNPTGDLASAMSSTNVRLFLVTGGVFVVFAVAVSVLVDRSLRRHPPLPPPSGPSVAMPPPSDWPEAGDLTAQQATPLPPPPVPAQR